MEKDRVVANAAFKLAKYALDQGVGVDLSEKGLPVAKSNYEINIFTEAAEAVEFNIEEVDDITFMDGFITVPTNLTVFRYLMEAIGRSKSIKQLYLHAATAPQWEFIMTALQRNQSITSISFSYNDMTRIAKALIAHPMTTECSFALPTSVQDKGVEELASALTASKSLTSFDMYGPLARSAVPSGQILPIFKALKNHRGLVKCKLHSIMFSSSKFDAVAFSKDTDDCSLASIITSNTGIKSLTVINCHISPLTDSLSEALRVNTSITELDLSMSNFSTGHMVKVLQLFKDNTTITSLMLDGINMDHASITNELNNVLARNILKKLSLYDCKLRINDLIPGLAANTSLTWLSLSKNKIAGLDVAELARSIQVRHLNLDECTTERDCWPRLFEGLASNSSVTRLNVRRVDLATAALEGLAKMLCKNNTMRFLDFKRGNTPFSAMKPVLLALKDNTALRGLYIESTQEQYHSEWDFVLNEGILDINYSLCQMKINHESNYSVDRRLKENIERCTGAIAFLKMMSQRQDVFFGLLPMEIWTKIFEYLGGVDLREIFSVQ